METGRSRPTREEEAQGAAKQQKISQVFSRGEERTDIQPPEPQAWLPAPMLGGEPLMDDALMKDFNGGIGCHVSSALEQTLLLPQRYGRAARFKEEQGIPQCQKISGHSMMLTLFFFFFFFF